MLSSACSVVHPPHFSHAEPFIRFLILEKQTISQCAANLKEPHSWCVDGERVDSLSQMYQIECENQILWEKIV